MATTSSEIRPWMEWLSQELSSLSYGEVGLTFCVSDSKVVRIEKIHRESFKAIENNH
jgi:hypothetical protein